MRLRYFTSPPAIVCALRKRLILFVFLLDSRWLLPGGLYLKTPFFVILNLFETPFLVFNLGMFEYQSAAEAAFSEIPRSGISSYDLGETTIDIILPSRKGSFST